MHHQSPPPKSTICIKPSRGFCWISPVVYRLKTPARLAPLRGMSLGPLACGAKTSAVFWKLDLSLPCICFRSSILQTKWFLKWIVRTNEAIGRIALSPNWFFPKFSSRSVLVCTCVAYLDSKVLELSAQTRHLRGCSCLDRALSPVHAWLAELQKYCE